MNILFTYNQNDNIYNNKGEVSTNNDNSIIINITLPEMKIDIPNITVNNDNYTFDFLGQHIKIPKELQCLFNIDKVDKDVLQYIKLLEDRILKLEGNKSDINIKSNDIIKSNNKEDIISNNIKRPVIYLNQLSSIDRNDFTKRLTTSAVESRNFGCYFGTNSITMEEAKKVVGENRQKIQYMGYIVDSLAERGVKMDEVVSALLKIGNKLLANMIKKNYM